MSTQRKPHSEDSPPSRTTQLARSAASTAVTTFHALNDAEPCYTPGSTYSTVRHTRPWVYYRGVSTVVPISILGSKPLPEDRMITLQRRGWRTGLLGWTIGGWLGGTVGKETDVTPAAEGKWDKVDSSRKSQFDREAREFLTSAVAPQEPEHHVLETAFVHIPVAAGDGYFRLLVKNAKGMVLAPTATFRIGSLSLRSAQPRGASPVTIIPELVLKSASATATAAAWASFYAAFPFLKIGQMIPGSSGWSTWALQRAYRSAGGETNMEELREKYRVEERRMKAEEAVYRTVPFGAAGVRTAYDLEQDAKMGRAGVWFTRE
ncbi:hypothetical protein FB45DRAFT_1053673 [Roridomyces roridus]|uniref:Uncharacterized protein n=1 Tax=Roridomyces roridus TaxID=1738132 RepID=A0AAD7C761_9AGAR|nr:hypothetical protein FB45DRAFT_1053673 [Roridomyces roridus]